ncbi:MAG: hypothetical protein GVY36_06315 [Verrucomicrobia bacterium]|jgi:hypothetical protein|nr:hypothetical protein [Verrucomicrobiota bacterium]
MSRKFVILFCCLNALLGVGLLWFILTPTKASLRSTSYASSASVTPEYTETELWAKAAAASTTREAFSYLEQLSADRMVFETSTELVDGLIQTGIPAYQQWPYFEALLQFHGSRSEALEDLQTLARLARQTKQALALRDAAFRSYIENFMRLNPVETFPAFALIDRLHEEGNHLSATALQAERFLRENGIVRDAGDEVLIERARETVFDTERIETNRLAAANILLALNEQPDPKRIREAIGSTDSERLKASLLRLLATSGLSDSDRDWLEDLPLPTPEQEALVRSILEH